MDFVLRHHDGLRTEAFDQRADIGADRRGGEQDRAVAGLGCALEGVAEIGDELVQARGLEGELAVCARADEGFGEVKLTSLPLKLTVEAKK